MSSLYYLLGKDQEVENCGNKAKNIHLLKLNKISVPDGAVITYNCFEKIEQIDLASLINSIGGYPVAVRSSGNFEDLENKSFAGLYETYLDIENEADLKTSIINCFNSVHNERVKDYISEIKVNDQELTQSMNVLIQKQITPKYAGVAFSVDPLSGKEENSLIDCCNGLGEKLVSGLITPTQYIINNQNAAIVSRIEGDQNVELSNKNVEDLKNQILTIQAYFKKPQDIEWAIDSNNQLWILQSRDITNINLRKDLGIFTNADLKDGGISARVCTPFMFSAYEKCMTPSMSDYFARLKLINKEEAKNTNWIIHKYGRAYWNAGVIKDALFKIPGFNEEEFDQDLGIQNQYGDKGPKKTATNIKTILGAIPVVIGLNKEFKNCIEMIETNKKTFNKINAVFLKKIEDFPKINNTNFFSDFIYMVEDFYTKTEYDYFRTIYNNSNFQSEFNSLLAKIERKNDFSINKINLISQISDISHMEINTDLNKVKSDYICHGEDSDIYKESFNYFVSKHYHHGEAELDITVPRWGEDLSLIKSMILNHDIINPKNNKKTTLNEILIEEFKDKKISNSDLKKIKANLEKARYFLVNREKMREHSTMSYYVLRMYLLELARRMKENKLINEISDIYYYQIDELLNFCSNNTIISECTLNYRKLLYNGFSKFSAPNEFGLDTSMSLEEFFKGKIITEGNFTKLKGIPCSNGILQAKVKIAFSLEEAKDIKKDEILVTKFTDPGWTPILAKSAGVITEVGGVLSHAAVIGREFGIPAILNIPNVTKIIPKNAIITMNGNDGTILFESH